MLKDGFPPKQRAVQIHDQAIGGFFDQRILAPVETADGSPISAHRAFIVEIGQAVVRQGLGLDRPRVRRGAGRAARCARLPLFQA